MKNETKFGIYTTFYNCERFVDKIFSNIERLNYENFEWHITDDYSSDNTKSLILDRLEKSPIKHKIIYCEQSEKKEMYWKPNIFFDETFDWIVLMDADDFADENFLIIYDTFIRKNKNLSLISSDSHKILESNNSLHSISYVLSNDKISKKINNYHPSVNYLVNPNYYCFGVLRAFNHKKVGEFIINDMLACAEDSYHVFWSNSYGEYLHIPRPMYMWNMRDDSESHRSNIPSNFNANFDIAINKLNNSDYGVNKLFNDIYVETCALGSYDIGKLKDKNVSLWSRFLSESQKDLLRDLYFDSNLIFNDKTADVHIFCLNYFSESMLKRVLSEIKNKKYLFYYQNQNLYTNTDEIVEDGKNIINNYSKIISEFVGHSWWLYFRHLVLKN
jgi:glycosyltransferase involved in cell wall biosynthesis